MTICGRCNYTIKDGEDYRNSMHYGNIHNTCHDKMLSDLGENS